MEPHFNCWANHDLAERLSPFRRDVLLERKRKTVVTVNKKNVIVRTSKYSETDNFICRGGQPLRGGTLEVVARGQRAGLAHLILSLNFSSLGKGPCSRLRRGSKQKKVAWALSF